VRGDAVPSVSPPRYVAAVPPTSDEQRVLSSAGLSAEPEQYGWGLWNLSDATLPIVRRLPTLEALELFESCESGNVTDRGLAVLAGHGALRQLGLGPGITDQGLAHVAHLSALKRLRLDSAEGVTDAGMAHLAKLIGLERLSLQFTDVGDAGLAQLAGLTALRELVLNDTRVTDAGLQSLATMSGLQELSLGSDPQLASLKGRVLPELSDTALQLLPRHLELRRLNLTGAFTANGMLALKQLPELEALVLRSRELSDDAVNVLASLTRLKQLDALGPLSAAAAARLKMTLSACAVRTGR
jgi:hypothetical protein